MFRKRVLGLILVIGILSPQLLAQSVPPPLKRAYQTIRPMDAYQRVKKMAGEEFAGRLTGSPGYTAAVRWAAGLFKKWGVKPAFTNYLQAFPAPYTMVENAEMTFKIKDEELRLSPGKDFLPLLFTDSGDVTADLVFVGWGISAPELHYDDYADVDVRGKIVVCFRGVPDRSQPGFRMHDEHRHRMKVARDKGALGLFYIYDDPIANPNGDWQSNFLAAVIGKSVANRLLESKRIKADDLRNDLTTYKRPISFPLSASVHYRVEARHFQDGQGYNVVGYVQGSDPNLRKECVVIGAHFDHCGRHAGLLFPGANDNASGSAVVMELAEAFAALKKKPKRSVVFVLFGGEEMGLKGSQFFASHLPGQFAHVNAMFNFDMVGEGDGLRCGYSAEPEYLLKAIEKADSLLTILRGKRAFHGIGGGSDYASFVKKGIPAATFASNGPHLFYHRSGDSIYRINPDILADAARLVFLAAYYVANR